ncbi:MAG: SigE family RNA polymerase sigma factor [Actinomycetota bacterium]|nr:SigE family RNA polymerase sigma factor [Actinomycetota bacterium]
MRVEQVDVAALYAAHRVQLVRMAVLLVDDLGSAEDVVQDAFIGLHRHRDSIREPQAALGYLRRAVVNGSRSTLRKRGTVRRHPSLVEVGSSDPPDTDLLLDEEHREVLAAVRSLPPGQRQVVVLRYWSNLSEAEIAEAVGISRGAVKSQASRGMDKIEKILAGDRR